jgi:long-subunit acyl-CoA synthetase (AMP-forming)
MTTSLVPSTLTAEPTARPRVETPAAATAGGGFELLRLLADLKSANRGGIKCLEREGWRYKRLPEVASDVEAAVQFLRAAGVREGQRVGLAGSNCYAWVVCDLALIELRAVSVAIVEAGEQTLTDYAERYGLRLVIGLQELPGQEAQSVARQAAELCGATLYRFAVTERDAAPDPTFQEPALIFSSGSSGRQKCLRISRLGIAHLVESFARVYPTTPADRILVFLPLSNVQQRLMVYGAIWLQLEIVLVPPQHLFRALKDGQPSVVVAPPLFYETIHARFLGLHPALRALVGITTWLVRLLPRPVAGALLRRLYGTVHDALGGNVRLMITGMAPIRRACLRFFHRAGFRLCEAYGLTECGLVSGNPPRAAKLGSVGIPFDPGSVSLGADSEIIVKRPYPLSRGYLDDNDPDGVFAKADTVHTGDLGHFDRDGYLYIDGRKKDMIVTAGGYKVQPEVLEQKLLEHPEVECCAVLASEGARSLYAVIALRGGPSDEAEARVRRFVTESNARLPIASRIVHVAFAPKPFSVDAGTRTRNLKLNRTEVARQFPYQDV